MEEKVDELYQVYLKEKLDLVFNENGIKISSPLLEKHNRNYWKLVEYQDGTFNYIDQKGKKLFKDKLKYDFISQIYGNYILVKKNEKWNIIDLSGNLIIPEWYDTVWEFHEGYARVKNGNKWNYVDEKGNLLFKEWLNYDAVYNFKDGLAQVRTLNGKYNYIDKSGKLLVDDIDVEIREFVDDFAHIKKNDKYRFIDKSGKIIGNTWFDEVKGYSEGFFLVKNNEKWYFIDQNGKPLNSEGFDAAEPFSNGVAIVCIGNKYNMIDTKGNLVLDEWYDDIHHPFEWWDYRNKGYKVYAWVVKDGEYNLLDKNGNIISPIWYSSVSRFNQGYAIVRHNGKENIIDWNCNYLFEEWIENGEHFCDYQVGNIIVIKSLYHNTIIIIDKTGRILFEGNNIHLQYSFVNGYAKVKNKDNGTYNFIDTNGNLLFKEWINYFELSDYDGQYVIVKRINDLRYNIIDKNGKPLLPEWYDVIFKFINGYAKVRKNGKFSFIDRKLNVVFPFVSMSKNYDLYSNENPEEFNNFVKYNDYVLPKDIEMDEYEVKKTLSGYICINKNKKDKYKLKYQPIKKYSDNYVICLDKENVYMYDRRVNEYRLLGKYSDIEYDNYFIFDNKNLKVYFVYADNLFDITNYYYDHLINHQELKMNVDDIIDIISKNEFHFRNMEEIDKLMQKEHEKNKEILKKQEREKNNRELKLAEKADQEKQKSRKENKIKLLKQLHDLLIAIRDNEDDKDDITRIPFKDIFIIVGDHKEIDPIYIGALKYINLSLISLQNVKISGIDFRGCNVSLYPQEVYNKDLSNCNFEGLHIEPFMDFTDVDIRGCKFSSDNSQMTLDFGNGSFENAIYDENTTYNGKSFVEIYGKCKKSSNNVR